jgi:hypothetical protein
LEIPWVAAQHIKTMAGDHGLNRLSDAIVIRSRAFQDSLGLFAG